jgi:hypothetical protein
MHHLRTQIYLALTYLMLFWTELIFTGVFCSTPSPQETREIRMTASNSGRLQRKNPTTWSHPGVVLVLDSRIASSSL